MTEGHEALPPRRIEIDFVSDVVCPWCVVGLRSLTKALQSVGPDVEAEIRFRPFELNPGMPPEGQDLFEHVQQKYGSTREQSDATRSAIRDAGAALGFEFRHRPDGRIWNTFNAHRLIHWAGLQGRARAMKEALFDAYFTAGENPSDVDVLAKAAAAAGLDGDAAREVVSSGAYADDVRKEQALWRNRGVQAVPSIVFEGRWMIQGGQAPEMFERAIRKIMAQPAQPPETSPASS